MVVTLFCGLNLIKHLVKTDIYSTCILGVTYKPAESLDYADTDPFLAY